MELLDRRIHALLQNRNLLILFLFDSLHFEIVFIQLLKKVINLDLFRLCVIKLRNSGGKSTDSLPSKNPPVQTSACYIWTVLWTLRNS